VGGFVVTIRIAAAVTLHLIAHLPLVLGVACLWLTDRLQSAADKLETRT
jgi:hypothetical protein